MIDDIDREGREKHDSVLGVKTICRQAPQRRPKRVKRSPRPVCHASDIFHWRKWRQLYREFALTYRLASQAFGAGDWETTFPPLAFRPPCLTIKKCLAL